MWTIIGAAFAVLFLAVPSNAQQCFVAGECRGNFIGTVADDGDPYECLALCQETSDCNWFTSLQDEYCNLYRTCEAVDPNICPTCISGEVTCPQLTCRLAGQCQGTLIHTQEVESHEQCQQLCLANGGCLFYTYSYEESLCYFFSDCDTQDDEFCTRCVSGQPRCGVDKFLMVVGGEPTYNSIEVLSVDPDVPLPDCVGNVAPLPAEGKKAAAGGTVIPGLVPFICGGTDNQTDVSGDCLRYSFLLDQWIDGGSLPYGNVESPGSTHDATWGLVVTGGLDDSGNFRQEATRSRDGNTFQELVNMPYEANQHCMGVIDANRVFVAGGYQLNDHLNDAYTFDITTGVWTDIGPLPSGGREGMGCGVARDNLGNVLLVMAGGYSFDADIVGNEVDIYNLNTGIWSQSDSALPVSLRNPASVAYGTSFLLVGGSDSSDVPQSAIYEFDAETQAFRLVRSAELAEPRKMASAMFVDQQAFPACNGE